MVRLDQGKEDEDFALLEKALAEQDWFLFHFRWAPWYSQYRPDPTRLEVERKMSVSKA